MCCPWWQCHETAVIKRVYTIEQCVFLVKRLYQTASVIMVQREFQVKSECRKAPSRSAINRLVNKFEMTGSMIDNKKGVVSKKKSVRTPENIHHIQVLMQIPRKSVKHLS
jgi:hypothetical protein